MKNKLKSLYDHYYFGVINMRVLKVTCTVCHAPATIKKSVPQHDELSVIYCACGNVECGHTFVLNLTFHHTLSPSALSVDGRIVNMLDNLSPQQKENALQQMQLQGI